jgi:DNA-binding transcriptional regulator YiaG
MIPMCVKCNGRRFRCVEPVTLIILGGTEYRAPLRSHVCSKCGASYTDSPDAGRFERALALDIATRGTPSGPAFKCMRKALGLRAVDLAPLLDAGAETLSRWESADGFVPRLAWVVLARMVREAKDQPVSTSAMYADLVEWKTRAA